MSKRPKILVTQRIHEEVQRRLSVHGDLDMNDSPDPWPRAEIIRRAASATAIMGFMTDQVDTDLLHAAPDLEVVACALKGYDNYDVDACTQSGVWLSIVPDLLTEPTAELAIGLAIGLARHVRQGDAYMRTGDFAGWRTHFYGTGLHGSVAAVVGLGQVGSAIIQRLQGFGCARILGVDPGAVLEGVEASSLDVAMRQADYLFVAAPLTASSHHLVSDTQLGHARAGQLIINVGRGSVVDEGAVLRALQAGCIGGYAADVFGCEDWQLPGRPRCVSPDLLALDNTLFTPHIGSAVRAVRLAIEQSAADNIIAVLMGKTPPNAINAPEQIAA
ncbi:MAG TPA: NAD(P)-dependent oxidoreductase [Polaromonas sp.]|uniref:NAD(P)-dependent oxidoreductase n=1 Tax=Polaromonas sp. TaxID=1869339 RepID=UPI002D68E80E|nr:NAD(P)-dependent oxidoreductase [Polaromonas sp.]HYW56086.1 NAD(P)-dependent oxidoreductase [Polaromonas sp.]